MCTCPLALFIVCVVVVVHKRSAVRFIHTCAPFEASAPEETSQRIRMLARLVTPFPSLPFVTMNFVLITVFISFLRAQADRLGVTTQQKNCLCSVGEKSLCVGPQPSCVDQRVHNLVHLDVSIRADGCDGESCDASPWTLLQGV